MFIIELAQLKIKINNHYSFIQNQCKDYNKRIRTSVSEFRNRKPMGTVNNYYTYTEAIERLGG